MDYLSVCSGIEAVSVAWHDFARPVGFAEVAKFPSAVLAHRFPAVRNYGDLTTLAGRVRSGEIPAPAVLVGGTPCQAFSLAGNRRSLDDARGRLTFSFVELADEMDAARYVRGEPAAVVIWENVPGCLNTHDNAFGFFLAGLAGEDDPLIPPRGKWKNAGCVFGPKRAIAWRVLNAQFFGLAQRRRRVFVIASSRIGFDPARVLFEFKSSNGNNPPRGSTPQKLAGTFNARIDGDGFPNITGARSGNAELIQCFGGGNTSGSIDVAACLTAKGQRIDFEVETFAVQSRPIAYDSRQDCVSSAYQAAAHVRVCPTLRAGKNATGGDRPPGTDVDTADSLLTVGMAVRRLTPRECERLQGFPDNWTNVPWRRKPKAPDSLRYAALGNSMAVPVMRWIGQRVLNALT